MVERASDERRITDDDGTLVGAALWEHEGLVSTLIALHVDVARRREGIATRLLGVFIATAVANGAERASLGVHEANPSARNLYAGAGFSEAGRDGPYILLERSINE